MNPDIRALLRLVRTENVGPVTWRRLMTEHGGDAAQALAAVPERARRGGRKGPLAIPSLSDIDREIEGVQALGGTFVTLADRDYPPLLAELPDSPPVLAVLGDVGRLSSAGIGMVGARNASAAGMRFAESLATELAQAGYVVVSGLARGIDAAAHRGALHGPFHTGGGTVAAIAGGLDVVYPPEHAALQDRLAREGAIVTEAPLGTTPQARHFPRRNRLIAGLSLGTVVVEAAMGSGSLITADLADRYSRGVFAVPGSPLDPRCRGSNNLLRRGFYLTETISDIVPFLRPMPTAATRGFGGFAEPAVGWGHPPGMEAESLDIARERMFSLLSYTPVTVDELVRHCQFSVSTVLAVLAEFELAGRVELVPGGAVVLSVPAGTD